MLYCDLMWMLTVGGRLDAESLKASGMLNLLMSQEGRVKLQGLASKVRPICALILHALLLLITAITCDVQLHFPMLELGIWFVIYLHTDQLLPIFSTYCLVHRCKIARLDWSRW